MVLQGKVVKHGTFTVYNLTVNKDHTYYVGTAHGGIWVHNECGFDIGKLQHEFKHASDFGIDGNWNSENGAAFDQALQDHIANAPEQIPGTYRGITPVTHYYDPSTQLWAGVNENGGLEGAWRFEWRPNTEPL